MWSTAPPVAGDPVTLSAELKRAAGSNADPMIIINADAKADFQNVVNAMEAARLAASAASRSPLSRTARKAWLPVHLRDRR